VRKNVFKKKQFGRWLSRTTNEADRYSFWNRVLSFTSTTPGHWIAKLQGDIGRAIMADNQLIRLDCCLLLPAYLPTCLHVCLPIGRWPERGGEGKQKKRRMSGRKPLKKVRTFLYFYLFLDFFIVVSDVLSKGRSKSRQQN
jgi:hypothetical protein